MQRNLLQLDGYGCDTNDGADLMDGHNRKDIRLGLSVAIILKQDQRTGKRTIGIVKDILTSSAHHPHVIKVRLEDGQIGRVQEILPNES
jgi:uncharacterized repeat protein (TIGR03833 family)